MSARDRRGVRSFQAASVLPAGEGAVELGEILGGQLKTEREAILAHVIDAARFYAIASWLRASKLARRARPRRSATGVWSRDAEEEAHRQNLILVKERCIIDAHGHLAGALGEAGSGHPLPADEKQVTRRGR